MVRILILIVIGFILVKILKRMIASADSKSSAQDKSSAEEKMIQCANCGCHVPISESISKNNQLICNNPECQH